jgi:hypothetical protein
VVAESDRNRLLKIQRALLLAASDMEQAAAAARALEGEADDHNLMRALETAIAVCYARAFTQSSLHRLNREEYEPSAAPLAELHRTLCQLRDEVYAHTDKTGGRSASLLVNAPVRLPGRIDFVRHEEWKPLSRAALPAALELFELQRQRFHEEAGKIQLYLDGPPAP